jgi:hypothetical protein
MGLVLVYGEHNQVTACYSGPGSERRHVRFKKLPDGSLLPVDRGRRRAAVIAEIGPALEAHGTDVRAQSTPGQKRCLDADELVARVVETQSLGMSVERACHEIADEKQCEMDSVRRVHYGNLARVRRRWARNDALEDLLVASQGVADVLEAFPNATGALRSRATQLVDSCIQLSREVNLQSSTFVDPELCGPVLAGLIHKHQRATGLPFGVASMEIAQTLGWSVAQLR